MKPRTQAELDALYLQYPDLEDSLELSRYCDHHNRNMVDNPNRAFGTGLGQHAHAEAQHWYATTDASGKKTYHERDR